MSLLYFVRSNSGASSVQNLFFQRWVQRWVAMHAGVSTLYDAEIAYISMLATITSGIIPIVGFENLKSKQVLKTEVNVRQLLESKAGK